MRCKKMSLVLCAVLMVVFMGVGGGTTPVNADSRVDLLWDYFDLLHELDGLEKELDNLEAERESNEAHLESLDDARLSISMQLCTEDLTRAERNAIFAQLTSLGNEYDRTEYDIRVLADDIDVKESEIRDVQSSMDEIEYVLALL